MIEAKNTLVADDMSVCLISKNHIAKYFGTWNNLLMEMGIGKKKRSGKKGRNITKEEIIQSIKDVAKKIGRRPHYNDFLKHGCVSPKTMAKHCGSWNKALVLAGFKTWQTEATKSDMIKEIKQVYEKIGKVPTITDMNKHGKIKANPIRHKFGTWSKAVEEAGLERYKFNRWTTRQ